MTICQSDLEKILFHYRLPVNRERSGSVVECLTRDRRAAGLGLTGITALWSFSKNINPRLVLVQPRKTCPYITERVLVGRKETNHFNCEFIQIFVFIVLGCFTTPAETV